RRQVTNRYRYQFAVYNIQNEKNAGFPYKELGNLSDPVVDTELRWLYFTLLNADGTPDSADSITSPNTKNYRTNIWEAKPDPSDDNAFYISHRGDANSENANNIVRISIIGDVLAKPQNADGTCPEYFNMVLNQCIPRTSDVMEFKRVYGFKGEVDGLHYPGDFTVDTINGQNMIIINHFRDLVYWPAAKRRFSIEAKSLDDGFWISRLESVDYKSSYYQVAVNKRGMALTCSFYGASVILMKITPGVSIETLKQIY
ncbi:MAG: hypothetical protein HQK54_05775, partial [Oligoflexales bacterium]|nr:hypothetical protein [Oligoflexales bacterium]